jgi:hypothetical protein
MDVQEIIAIVLTGAIILSFAAVAVGVYLDVNAPPHEMTPEEKQEALTRSTMQSLNTTITCMQTVSRSS